METISLKMDEQMLKEIDESLSKNNYSTRTELIRDALREKLEQLKKEELIKELMKFRGAAKKKTSDEELRRIREQVSSEMLEKYEKQFK